MTYVPPSKKIRLDPNISKQLSKRKPNFIFFEYTENILSQLKDSRVQEIFSLRYSKEEKKPSWSSIASKMNMSTQTAINLHNKGLSMLRKKMDSKKLLDNI